MIYMQKTSSKIFSIGLLLSVFFLTGNSISLAAEKKDNNQSDIFSEDDISKLLSIQPKHSPRISGISVSYGRFNNDINHSQNPIGSSRADAINLGVTGEFNKDISGSLNLNKSNSDGSSSSLGGANSNQAVDSYGMSGSLNYKISPTLNGGIFGGYSNGSGEIESLPGVKNNFSSNNYSAGTYFSKMFLVSDYLSLNLTPSYLFNNGRSKTSGDAINNIAATSNVNKMHLLNIDVSATYLVPNSKLSINGGIIKHILLDQTNPIGAIENDSNWYTPHVNLSLGLANNYTVSLYASKDISSRSFDNTYYNLRLLKGF
jgi:hypothetical protein